MSLKFGILLALIAAGIVAYGGWVSMQEEGTTFESARDQLRARYGQRPAPRPPAAQEPPAAPEPFDEDERPGAPPPPV